MKRGEALPLSR